MIKPTDKQLRFMDWEFGVFFHFGIRTFYEGHTDWDEKPMPIEGFYPEKLDCRQWIRTAKSAGARYAVLVTKHHDGFANWPSKYTDYCVANTKWKDGKGDIVREFVDACREYGLKVGLYYSPAEFGSKKRDAKGYDDYFINQISELLQDYGTIDYLWFDGCGSEGHQYDEKRIIKAIRTMQPDILIFNMWDPDTRWVGNEEGYAPDTNQNEVDRVDFSVMTKEKDVLGSKKFLPAECDCRLREQWFYCDTDKDTLKSVEKLMDIYEHSVGNGANLLLNIGPGRDGLVLPEDEERMREFGEEIRRRYGSPSAQLLANRAGLSEESVVDRVILMEDMAKGQQTTRFQIIGKNNQEQTVLFEGTTIGHKKICKFPPVNVSCIEITMDAGRLRNGYVFCK